MVGSSQWLLISMVQLIGFPPMVGFSQWLLISMVQSRSSLLLLNDGFLALSKRSAAFQHSSKLVVVNQTAQNSRPLLSIKGRPKYYGSSKISRSQLLVDFSSPVPNVDFSNLESNVDLNKSRTPRGDFSNLQSNVDARRSPVHSQTETSPKCLLSWTCSWSNLHQRLEDNCFTMSSTF